jgi:3-deoxy-D-manno-octulosonic-acid transferase
MRPFYTFGIRLYTLAIRVSAIFNLKAKAWVAGRKNQFIGFPKVHDKYVCWFHCASLGEFDMALPIMREIKNRRPETFLLVTFFSPSGMQHYNKREHCVDFATYLPSDTSINARKFIAHFSPKMVFFVKYEFWSNYISEAKGKGVKVLSVCTLLRKNQRFFKWYGGFFRKTLRSIDFFYTQNNQTSLLLADLGITLFQTVGDTRFDRVIQFKNSLHSDARLTDFLSGEKAIVLGSTWPDDEKMLIPFILKNPSVKFILAPHDIREERIREIEMKLSGITCRFTDRQLTKNVLILNTIGHLSGAYSFGKWAYVGGGFSGKLHNILEPSVFGLPVVFGPKFNRFPEAEQFVKIGTAFSVKTLDDLNQVAAHIELNKEIISVKSIENVYKNEGAASRIIDHMIGRFQL